MTLSRMHRTLDDDKLNDPIPTFEVTLSALELDFDRQLSAAMDNIFDNEFAALRDLEPIVTTTTPLAFSDNLEAPLAGVKASKASVSILGSDCKGGRLLKSVHNPGDDGETITRTTRNSRRSASLSSYTSDDDTITRTTNNPAASSSSTRGSDKPTLRETNVSQEEPTIRTTNTSAFGPILDCSPKQTSHNTSQNVDEQVVITQSTKAVELAYRSPAEGMNGEAAPPSNAMPLIPNAFLPTNPAQTFGASYPMGSQSPFVSELPRGTVWSSGRASSHSIPPVGITLPEVVGEDIEMTISDLTASQGIFPEATGDSSHGIYDKNASHSG
ncbi:hypothetical protein B0H11DRAFT_209729 [Mycena galericulata]|nr:hypothetical protein B0H11DRAFT_209729 [Mycena galericulata]